MNITRWSPDTCECVIEYSCDDNGNISHHNTVKNCSSHPSAKLNDILAENQIKNKALNAIAQNHPEYAKLADNGSSLPDMDKLSFVYDKNRNLIIRVSNDKVSKSDIQNTINDSLGIGKATIG